MASVRDYHHVRSQEVPDPIVELDGTRPSAPRRADRFVVGAILAGSFVFAVGVTVTRPMTAPVSGAATSAVPSTPSVAPVPTPLPTGTPRFRIQPPIFIAPGGGPLMGPSGAPDRSFIPAPGDTWRYYGSP